MFDVSIYITLFTDIFAVRIHRHNFWLGGGKGKGKVGRAPPERRRGAHPPFKAIEPVGG